MERIRIVMLSTVFWELEVAVLLELGLYDGGWERKLAEEIRAGSQKTLFIRQRFRTSCRNLPFVPTCPCSTPSILLSALGGRLYIQGSWNLWLWVTFGHSSLGRDERKEEEQSQIFLPLGPSRVLHYLCCFTEVIAPPRADCSPLGPDTLFLSSSFWASGWLQFV